MTKTPQLPGDGTPAKRSSRKKRSLIALALAGLMSATAMTALPLLPDSQPAVAQTVFNRAPAEGFADLVEKVMPAVISVEVRYGVASNRTDRVQGFQLPELDPDNPFRQFFERFGGDPRRFGMPQMPFPRAAGQGSGFIISEDGYAVTNNHVVTNAEEVTVTLSDGKEYRADVVGTDPKTDLALLKIQSGDKFQYVTFAETEARVGDWVIAVGNPFGFGGSVTTGIVSARERNIGNGPYADFLQIDAPINKGNSGGPAFNLAGEVIGVNTAIYSPSGGNVGIGFAIPATVVKEVIADLREKGQVTRGWLGVQIQPVTDEIAESLGLSEAKGAIVADVTEDSPALKAGIKTGDTIVKVNGEDVANPRDLARKVASLDPGQETALTVYRNGKEETVTVTLGTMPGDEDAAERRPADSQSEPEGGRLGLQLVPAEDGQGVQIASVQPGSPAAERGLRPGDIILEVDGIQVDQPEAVRAAVERSSKEGKKSVLMLVRSGERQRFVAMPAARS